MIRRLLFHGLCAGLGFFSLALATFAIRGFWMADGFSWTGPDHVGAGFHATTFGTRRTLSSWHGSFYLVSNYQFPPNPGTWWSTQRAEKFTPFIFAPTHSTNYLLFQNNVLIGEPLLSSYHDATGKSDMILERDVVIPTWGPLVICGILWALLIVRWTRRRRLAWRNRSGMCLQCGYDLRAQSTGERCPECGAAKPALAPPH